MLVVTAARVLSMLLSLPLEFKQTSEDGDQPSNLLSRFPFPFQADPPFPMRLPLPDFRHRFSLINDRVNEKISAKDLGEMISVLSDLVDVHFDREDDDSQVTAQVKIFPPKDILDILPIILARNRMNQVNAQSIAEAQKARFFKEVGRFFKDRVKPTLKNGFGKVKDAFNDVIIPDILVPVARDVLEEGVRKALESVG